jgi:hypothetical protein
VGSELQRLFVQRAISTRPLSLDAFIESLGSVYEMAAAQQDAHEFFTALMERLELDLGPEFGRGSAALFQVTIHRTIIQRQKKVELFEKSISIPIPAEGYDSLPESLAAMGSEKPSTYEDQPAIESQTFSDVPPLLIFQLCRYRYDR